MIFNMVRNEQSERFNIFQIILFGILRSFFASTRSFAFVPTLGGEDLSSLENSIILLFVLMTFGETERKIVPRQEQPATVESVCRAKRPAKQM